MSVPSSDSVSCRPSGNHLPQRCIRGLLLRPTTRGPKWARIRRGTLARFTSRLALGVAFAALLGATGGAQVQPNATGWSASNYNESANRYSPLDQITAANVATLQPAWRFHLKPTGYTGALKVDEAIPVVIANTMYIALPSGAIPALNVTLGGGKWKITLSCFS